MTRKILIAIDPLTPDFEIIETDAPNEIITEQMKINAGKIENGEEIDNPYSYISSNGFSVSVISSSDNNDFGAEHDAEFYVLAEGSEQ